MPIRSEVQSGWVEPKTWGEAKAQMKGYFEAKKVMNPETGNLMGPKEMWEAGAGELTGTPVEINPSVWLENQINEICALGAL